jgi:glycosyltransferase involved in cell wall biosynthesis
MRVVICRDMPGESISMDVYADGLVTALRELHPQWEVFETNPRPTGVKGASSIAEGMHKYYEKFLRYPLSLRQYKADVYHIVDQSYAHLAYWLKDVPIVITCHDLINFRQPENLWQRARFPPLSMAAWRFSVKGLHKAHHILADSRYTAQDIKQMVDVDAKRITVIPFGLDTTFRQIQQEDLIQSSRTKYGVSSEKICLLHVGGNDPRKNVTILLEVVKVLRTREIPAVLWKIGADFTPQQKQLIEEYGLEGKTTYLGQMSHKDWALILAYNAADIVIIPSLYEGFGMPVLEAMACGTPVIASNVSSLPEVAGDAARLVSPEDVEGIVNEVIHIAHDPIFRQRLINRGLSRAKIFFWNVIAPKIAKIYELVSEG